MATDFKQPEEEIIKENDEATKFYFTIQGDCLLNIRDEKFYLHQAQKLLVEGTYFGEIGLLYKRPRTASISAKNYVTLAYIHKNSFNNLLNKIRNLQKILIKQVCSYRYDRKDFFYRVAKQIDSLNGISVK